MPHYSALIQHWHLDQEITFLNHGSYGACPKAILEEQSTARLSLEEQPVKFFSHTLIPRMDEVRQALSTLLRTHSNNLALIPNATQGVNTVLRTYPLQAGDEILVTNHGYNACNNAALSYAEKQGATIQFAKIPFPIECKSQVIEAVERATSSKTKLAIIDHITSPTALVTPIQELVALLNEKGIDTLVDGAHAPGQLDINLSTLSPAYYTGNCHKWLCTPKGSAFLYVREDKHQEVRPLAISHGANAPTQERSFFRNEFDWQGTHDPTAHMVIPQTLQLMGGWFENGWDDIRKKNHQLACQARDIIATALNMEKPAPDDMLGAMAAFPLDASVLPGGFPNSGLQKILMDDYQIEVPVFDEPYSPIKTLRLSAQLYNDISQYEYLGHALSQIQKKLNIKLGMNS